MKARTPITILLLLTLVSLTSIVSACGLREAIEEGQAAADLEITTPSLDKVSDGTYQGSYEAGLTSAKVEVVMANGRIADLQLLEHDHGRGEAAEAIIDTVVEEQSLEVDAVSGATISSKVILKSIERALTPVD